MNYEVLSANVKRPAGLLLSDPRVAADLVFNKGSLVEHLNTANAVLSGPYSL